MNGDFSRSTFDPRKHYSSVRMQQGRVQLDADWNEHVDILLHLIKTQMADLAGTGATLTDRQGFAIFPAEPAQEPADASKTTGPGMPASGLPDFMISAGHYYVEGILCENEEDVLFSEQPDYPAAAFLIKKPDEHKQYLVYLDVWQRHITAVEDPAIREVALGGSDTTTRTKTVWQVKLLPITQGELPDSPSTVDLYSLPDWTAFVRQASQKCQLKARTDSLMKAVLENRLYRVEIHSVKNRSVTFKWSRENGSVVFPITPDPELGSNGEFSIIVDHHNRDIYQLHEGSWVEICDDETLLNGCPLPLCRVRQLDIPDSRVILLASPEETGQIIAEFKNRDPRHALLRRWEGIGELPIPLEDMQDDSNQKWFDLENGIQISFSGSGNFQPGDYWLIPARNHLKDGIQWPQKDGQPQALDPHGIRHWFAPLALLRCMDRKWSFVPQVPAGFRTLPQIEADIRAIEKKTSDFTEQLNQHLQAMEDLKIAAALSKMEKTISDLEDRLNSHLQEFNNLLWLGQMHPFETVRAEVALEKGDLVALDHSAIVQTRNTGDMMELHVRRACDAESERLIGVVWEPIETEEEGAHYQIVLRGRTRCKVIGLVEPGDLLVPSEEPGYARRAGQQPRPGTILGKALSVTRFEPNVIDDFKHGSRLYFEAGTVEVLVTLG